MLELLLQPPLEGSAAATAAGRFISEAVATAAFEWRQPAAADAAGVGRTAVKAEQAAAGVLGIDDSEFDLFFEPLQPAILKAEEDDTLLLLGGGEALFDRGTEEFLQQLLLTDLSGLPIAMDQEVPDEDDDSADFSSSPASFEPTAASPLTPTSPAPPSSPTLSDASSRSYRRLSSGSVAGGRVDKKKEANREAAYRYRMKQRLGDSALEQRRSELQSRTDELAGGVSRAEDELKFLTQMCRQIFSSRRQLLLSNGNGRLGSQLT